jgi:large subunit ribosomal protein L1
LDNITAFIDTVTRLKPASSKGAYFRSIAVSTSMGPGIKVDPIYAKELVNSK